MRVSKFTPRQRRKLVLAFEAAPLASRPSLLHIHQVSEGTIYRWRRELAAVAPAPSKPQRRRSVRTSMPWDDALKIAGWFGKSDANEVDRLRAENRILRGLVQQAAAGGFVKAIANREGRA